MRKLIAIVAALLLLPGVAPAQGVKVSNLPAATTLNGSELVPIVQGGATVRTTTSAVAALVAPSTVAANTVQGNFTALTALPAPNTMPSCPDTGTNHLNYVAGSGIVCGTAGGGGGGGTPGGSSGQLQWNNGGAFGGTSAVTTTGTSLSFTSSTGTAPFAVSSTTNVPNLNASSLGGATFAAPGTIGSTAPSSGAFTTVSASTPIPITSGGTGGATAAAAQSNLAIGEVLVNSSSFTASGGPTVALPATYKAYRLVIWQLQNTSSGFSQGQFSYDGGSTYKSGASDYNRSSIFSTSPVSGAAASSIAMGGTTDVSTTIGTSIDCVMYLQPVSGSVSTVSCTTSGVNTANSLSGVNTGYTAVVYGTPNFFRWVPSAGTVTGRFALYGIMGF